MGLERGQCPFPEIFLDILMSKYRIFAAF